MTAAPHPSQLFLLRCWFPDGIPPDIIRSSATANDFIVRALRFDWERQQKARKKASKFPQSGM